MRRREKKTRQIAVSDAGSLKVCPMKNVSKPDTSGNTPLDPTRLSEPINSGELHDGPPDPATECEPHEVDPDPDQPPPVFKNEEQAALNAQARGFDVIPLRSDGHTGGPQLPKQHNGERRRHQRALGSGA
jgi:hypothetical protein